MGKRFVAVPPANVEGRAAAPPIPGEAMAPCGQFHESAPHPVAVAKPSAQAHRG